MPTLVRFFDLITTDALTMSVAATLALSILAFCTLHAWRPAPATGEPARPDRTQAARTMAAAGALPAEIARATGFSRDALALLISAAPSSPRQESTGAAILSAFRRAAR